MGRRGPVPGSAADDPGGGLRSCDPVNPVVLCTSTSLVASADCDRNIVWDAENVVSDQHTLAGFGAFAAWPRL
ncbi:MAG: hypothetical protein JWN06_3412 [Propionibacteriaceae bacterium]|jgi:hypothetical protein|nr:hypothetical protein [Propionibacteriaceae bacterium]